MTDIPAKTLPANKLMGEILDLFLPLLAEPYSYQERQDRLHERVRKAGVLEHLLNPTTPAEPLTDNQREAVAQQALIGPAEESDTTGRMAMTDTSAPTTPREELHAMLRSAVGPVKSFGWQVDQLLDRIIKAEARAIPAEPQTDSADEYEGWLLDGIRSTPAEALQPLDIDEQAALLDEAIGHADFGEVARSEVMYSAVRALHENNAEIAARHSPRTVEPDHD